MTTRVAEGDIPKILATIRKRESGNNYTAHAKKGSASGAYQFIDSTWRSNAQAAGVDISKYPTAGSAPPEIQDKVAAANVRNILQANGWDAEAVPAAWYLGHVPAAGSAEWDKVPAPQYGNTATPRSYVSSWMKAFNGTTMATADNPSPGQQAVQNLSPEEMNVAAQQFGFAASFLNDPEIGPIIKEAITGGKTQQWLDARLRTTTWYTKYSASTRAWRLLAESDPATANQRLASQQAAISDQASKLGLSLTPERAKELAYYSLGFGWTDSQLQDALNAELKYSPEQAQKGQIGTVTGQVKALAARYYLNISDEAAFNYGRQITAGQLDMGGVEATFKGQAKGKFSAIAQQIDAGITPADFFDPYKGEIAKLLDIPEASIDLVNDPRWSQVLSTAGADGKLRPMTISEAQTLARNTPQWDATQGATSSAAHLGEQLLKTFGAVG